MVSIGPVALLGVQPFGWVAAVAVLGILVGCGEPGRWREMLLPGLGLGLSMPCQPIKSSRPVAIAELRLQMTLWNCSYEDVTYAIAMLDAPHPDGVTTILTALTAVLEGSLSGGILSREPAQIPGASPHPLAARVLAHSKRTGAAAQVIDAVLFRHGLRVYQATRIASESRPVVDDAFLMSLKVAR